MNRLAVQFLKRVRRRWTAWRVVETASLGAGAAAGMGVLLLPLAWWGGVDAAAVAWLLLGLGAVAGGAAGMLRRPSQLATAMEIDRQLDLHDLFSTAVTQQAFADPQFESIVLGQAERVCHSGSLNELMLRRLDGRVWGGVGLTSALLITLSMLVSQPPASLARQDSIADAPAAVAEVQPSRRYEPPAIASGPNGSREARAENSSPASGDDESSPGESDAAREGSTSNDRARGMSDGAGGAMARTGHARVDPISISPAESAEPSASGDTTGVGSGGIGAGSSAAPGEGASADATSTGATSTGPFPARRTPPWQSPTWPRDRDAAMRQLESGQIPDAYREMVREYFTREPAR